MKYAREYKVIAKRMAEAAELEQAWKDVEIIYGKKATKQLKELAPADPLLLHDLMVVSHLNDGKTKKEVTKLLTTYTEKDWAYDMENFAHTIKKAKQMYFNKATERTKMPLFGSKGQMANNSKRINWWGDGSTQIKTDNVIYDGNSMATKSGNTMWTKNGTVTSSGNTIWTPNGTYNFSGGVMHGPNGETWTGVNSKDDAMSIIAHKLK